MYTLGYRFKPWLDAKAIADGPAIREYIADTAAEHGIEPHIRYGHRVLSTDWSPAEACWTVQGGCRGADGALVHPQFWPEGLGCAGQRVVVIGSGATAVTLVPELAKARLVGLVQQAVGPGVDVATHFTPRYNPWDQRVCLVPTATCSPACAKAAPPSSPTRSRVSRRTACGCSRGRNCRPT